MDFDGFLVQMRIELERIERAAEPSRELVAPVEMTEIPAAANEAAR